MSTETAPHKAEASAPLAISPYNLIYEHPSIGRDPWRLLVAAVIQSNVSANIGPVLTHKILEKFPTSSDLLKLDSVFSLPECKSIQNLPWILKKLQGICARLVAGESIESLEPEIGSYGVDVWTIFGCQEYSIVTSEFDLKAYLEWKQSQD
jgi:hypothetical protein